MQCPECQTTNSSRNLFCEGCGIPLPRPCPSCGRVNSPKASFCGGCAADLSATDSPPVAEGTPSLATNTDARRQLAKLILGVHGTSEGERKVVTVLFADVVGSTHLIESMDPEEALKRLEPALNAMIGGVHRYEGTVNRVQGDGIMAIFGAPLSHEDHAVRACLAALAMQETIAAMTDLNMQIRVGLHSGEVVVRPIGNDFWIDYDAVGPVVHLAKRMETMAEPGAVRCSADTYELAKGFIDARFLGETRVHGITGPIASYQPVGSSLAKTRWQIRAAEGLGDFVGRQREIGELAGALNNVRAGRGQVVAVTGEPGIGKSRLIHEFIQSYQARGCTISETGAVAHGNNTSYLPINNLLRTWFGIGQNDDQTAMAERVRTAIASLSPPIEDLSTAARAVLNLRIEDREWQQLEPPQRRDRIVQAIEALTQRKAEDGPLILVVEDLHWVDSETQAVLDRIVENIGAANHLLLVTYRPEYMCPWTDHDDFHLVQVEPFDRESSNEFLHDLVGADSSLDSLKDLLVDKTQGTPLFLEESVRTLVETGALSGDWGDLRLTKKIDEIEIPNTVQAVLAARIDRLPPEHKSLLQTASVIGMDVPVPLLQAVSQLPDDMSERVLGELQEANFLKPAVPYPDADADAGYVFNHAFTHDVVYESLLSDKRRDLHGKVVGAIEARFGNRLEAQVERLAHHALRGQLWEKAVGYLRQSGSKAIEHSAYLAAIGFFERALTALRHLPEDRAALQQAIDTRLSLRVAIGVTGDYARWYAYLGEAEELATKIADRPRLAAISISKTHVLNVVGDVTEAIEVGSRARRIAAETKDPDQLVAASYFLSQAHEFHGEYRQATKILVEMLPYITERHRHHRFGTTGTGSVLYLGLLGYSHAFLGEFDRAFGYCRQACEIAGEVDRPFDTVLACFADGVARLLKGDIDDAAVSLRGGLDACEVGGIDLMWPVLASRLGFALTVTGDAEEGRKLVEAALPRSERMAHMHGWCQVYCGLAHLQAARPEVARQHGQAALEIARRHRYQGIEAWALWLVGTSGMSADTEQGAEAKDCFMQAIALTERLELLPQLAHSRVGLGQCYLEQGRQDQARAEIQPAVELYRTLDMPFWAKRSQSALHQTI